MQHAMAQQASTGGARVGRQRVLACDRCGQAVSMHEQGGTVGCSRCGAHVVAHARPDTVVPPSPGHDEHGRIARLRPQDGKPLLPPPGLESLVQGGGIAPHRMQEAIALWGSTRAHLVQQPSDIAAAERLMFLVHMLRNVAAQSGDTANLRGQLEASLEAMQLPRHRQQIRCALARESAKAGDFEDAEAWLAGCDPYSEDLDLDTEYRVTRAFIDTGHGRYDHVLHILGSQNEQVPIQDRLDPVAAVLRANAHERLGNIQAAVQVLSGYMSRGMSAAFESVIKAMPAQWYVCHQSFPAAQGGVRESIGNRAASGGGGMIIGVIVMVAGCIPLFVIGATALAGQFDFFMLIFLLFPIIFGGMGLKMIRGALRAKKIAAEGVTGRGKIVNVAATGTRINHTPVMKLTFDIQVEGYPPARAHAKKLMHGGQAQQLVGREVGVIWHPDYPDDVVPDL